MLIRHIMYTVLVLACSAWFAPASADENRGGMALKEHVEQPYVVKKNDTLWDIANHFFKDPKRWMQIWERNLYITNPDLIYPGNKIWFDEAAAAAANAPAGNNPPSPQVPVDSGDDNPATKMNHQRLMTAQEAKTVGGLTTIRPAPRIIVKEVQRIEGSGNVEVELPEMVHRDYINPDDTFPSVGYIIDSEMERLNYGAGDELYVRFAQQLPREGDRFDIFRKSHEVEDIQNGEYLGELMRHLGRIEITQVRSGVYKGRVLYAYAEISQGDLLVPAAKIKTRVVPSVSLRNIQGTVVYLQDDTTEVSANQVIAINLGEKQDVKPGMRFFVFREGRSVKDPVTENVTMLPEERIAQMMVISVSSNSAMALVTEAESPIHIGDAVRPAGR